MFSSSSRTLAVLRKAKKGETKSGHKYTSKKPDGRGGWIYEYNEPATAKGKGKAPAVPDYGDMMDALVGSIQTYLASGKPLQIGTMTRIFPMTNPADIRRRGNLLEHRWNGKWQALTDELSERLAVAVGAMGPMSHARAGGTRPAPKVAPSPRAVFDQFQKEMQRLDQVVGDIKTPRAQEVIANVQETHGAELDAIARAYQTAKTITLADAQAALDAARTVVQAAEAAMQGPAPVSAKDIERQAKAVAKKLGPAPKAMKPLEQLTEPELRALMAAADAYRDPIFDLDNDVRAHPAVAELEGAAGRLHTQAATEIERQKRAAQRAAQKPSDQILEVLHGKDGAFITLYGDRDKPVIAGPYPDGHEAEVQMHMLAQKHGYRVFQGSGAMAGLFAVGAKQAAQMARNDMASHQSAQEEATRRLAAGDDPGAPASSRPTPAPAPAPAPTGSKAAVAFGDTSAMKQYRTRKSMGSRTMDVLRKAKKGEAAAGHKYEARTWDGDHWVYHYKKEPGQHMTADQIFAAFEQNKHVDSRHYGTYMEWAERETRPDQRPMIRHLDTVAYGTAWAVQTGRLPATIAIWIEMARGKELANIYAKIMPHASVSGDVPAAIMKLWGSPEKQQELQAQITKWQSKGRTRWS